MRLEVEQGKNYKIKLPFFGKAKRVHVDFILNNPTCDDWNYQLIVTRTWNRISQDWEFRTFPYWELAFANDWEFKNKN